MKKYDIKAPLPAEIVQPLDFMEPDKAPEGQVNHPLELVYMFEPVDVLNGASELRDVMGHKLTIICDDKEVVLKNEYPDDLKNIYFVVE